MQMSNQTEVTDVATSPITDTSSIQTSITVTAGLERCLTVTVPAEHLDSKVGERIQEATKTVNLNGFRKGRVPFKVVKRRFGTNLRQEVLTDAVNETFQQAIITESVKPVAQPDISLKQFDEGKDLQYTATFEIYPQITLSDFSAIEITVLSAEIEDADVDEMVEQLRKKQASYKSVERVAAMDDEVTIDYVGTKDGEPFVGGKADNQRLVLGSNSMIPGFEENIAGMSTGEERVISLTFPDDYHAEELKGANVEFTVKVKQIAEQVLPQLDEQFLAKFGVADGDVEKFRADVRVNMQRELEAAAKTNLKTQVVDSLIDSHELELPKTLVTSEIEALRQQMAAQFKSVNDSQNIDLKAIFPDDSLTDEALRRVSFALLASEIAKSNNIVVDKERVSSAIKILAESYEQPEVLVNHYYQNPQLLNKVQSSVLEDQVIETVSKQARLENKKVNYFELVKR